MKTRQLLEINESKKSEFAGKMAERFNHAALTLMLSVGHRTGLFDAMKDLEAADSKTIAAAAGLNERYVREALGAFVTGQVVEYDRESGTYYLPPEHAAFLTRGSTDGNMAATAQWISVLSSVEDRIVECFKSGGGTRYEEYRRFHEVMAEESHQTVVQPLMEHLLPLVPGLKSELEKGMEVLDVGCGSGSALVHLARHFPNSRFTGYDMCGDAVETARGKARAEGLQNISFEVRDAAGLQDQKRFDLILTFDAIHDQADPGRVLWNISRALKDDGLYFMQEISGSSDVHEDKEHPLGAFLYTVSCMHCMSVSLGQNGQGLGAMWGRERAVEMLKEAGFSKIEIKQLPHDLINDYYLIRKS